MSHSYSTMPLGYLPPTASQAGGKSSLSGMSLNGAILFVAGLLVIASGYTSMRPVIMGLSLQPTLVPIALASPFVIMARIHAFPLPILAALLVFSGMYFFSVFNGASVAVNEIFKIACAVMTIVTTALLVRRRGDFVAGALGLSIAIALLATRGLQEEGKQGIEVMQGANKNSYSMYALPAILLAGHIWLNMQSVPKLIKNLLLLCTIPTLMAIFMSGNRSGYLCSVLVGLMLFWDRRGKGLIMVGGITMVVALLILNFGSTAALEDRIDYTIQGNSSDEHRFQILNACLRLALENPIIGVSPQRLPYAISNYTERHHVIDPHNVYAHLAAGSGLICFGALLMVGWAMWTWKPSDGKVGGKEDPTNVARRLMRMMVVLWAVRGFFSREVLYNPSFNLAFGLVIGFCLLAEITRKREQAEGRQPWSYLPLPPGPLPRGVR